MVPQQFLSATPPSYRQQQHPSTVHSYTISQSCTPVKFNDRILHRCCDYCEQNLCLCVSSHYTRCLQDHTHTHTHTHTHIQTNEVKTSPADAVAAGNQSSRGAELFCNCLSLQMEGIEVSQKSTNVSTCQVGEFIL